MKSSINDVRNAVRQWPLADQIELIHGLLDEIEASTPTPDNSTEATVKAIALKAAISLSDLTYKIIGCAMSVHSSRGPGQRESIYQRDLEVHLAHSGLLFTPQKLYEVFDSKHGGKLIGYYIPDFVVDRRVIVEIKALDGLDSSHTAQVIGYLAVSGCQVGLLINFGASKLQYHRILPPIDINQHHFNRRWLFQTETLKGESAENAPSTDFGHGLNG